MLQPQQPAPHPGRRRPQRGAGSSRASKERLIVGTMRSTSLRTSVNPADRNKHRQRMVTDSESRAATADRQGLSWEGWPCSGRLPGCVQPLPTLLAGLTNTGHPYQCGLALGTRIGARVAFQGRMIVDPRLGTDHTAEDGAGPDRPMMWACRSGSERSDWKERN